MTDTPQEGFTLPAPETLPMPVPLAVHDRDALLVDMYSRLGRIEANTEHVSGAMTDHEGRIRSLEERQWSVPGISLIVALLSIFGFHR